MSDLRRSGLWAEMEAARMERSIRELELSVGLRDWDARDEAEAKQRLHAQVRYVPMGESLTEFLTSERERLTA